MMSTKSVLPKKRGGGSSSSATTAPPRYHHHHHPTATAAAAAATTEPSSTEENNNDNNDGDDSSELDVLQMGSSVDVNDEVRRTLAAETRQIEAATDATEQQSAQEIAVAAVFAKRRDRNGTELRGLRTVSIELLDSIRTNWTIFGGLESTVRTEILVDNDNNNDSSHPAAAPVTPFNNNNANDDAHNNNNEQQPNTAAAADWQHAAQIDEITAELQWMDERHAHCASEIRDMVQRRDETVGSLQRVVGAVARDRLAEKQAEAHRITVAAQTTVQDEAARLRHLRAQTAAAVARQAALSKECDGATASLEAEQRAAAARLSQLQAEIAQQEEELRRDEHEVEKMEQQTVLLEQHKTAPLQTSVETATELIAQRQEATAVLEQEREAHKALFAEQASKEAAVAHAQEQLDGHHPRQLHEAQEQTKQVAALKQENDAATTADSGDPLGEQREQEAAALQQVTELLESGAVVIASDDDDDAQAQLERALRDSAVQQTETDAALDTETEMRDAKREQRQAHQRALDEHKEQQHDEPAVWQSVVDEQQVLQGEAAAQQQCLDEHHRVAAHALEWGRTLKIFRSAKAAHKVLKDKERLAAKEEEAAAAVTGSSVVSEETSAAAAAATASNKEEEEEHQEPASDDEDEDDDGSAEDLD